MDAAGRIHEAVCGPTLDKIDLKQLKYFMAVAEAGSFSRASVRLKIAQSHLSRQVMRLETALGHRLFVRRPRHVELTDAGQILCREAQFISLKLGSLPQRMNEADAGSIGSLCLGLTAAECFHGLLAKIVESVLRDEPRLSLSFRVETPGLLLERLLDRSIHAYFAPPPASPSAEIQIDCLEKEPLLLAVHKQHRFAAFDEIGLSEAVSEPFILCEREASPDLYDQIIKASGRAGFSPRVAAHVPHPACALLLASAGVGVTFVPLSMRSVHGGGLHFVSLAGNELNTSLVLVTRANEHVAGVRLLRKHAQAAAAVRQAALRPHPVRRTAGGR